MKKRKKYRSDKIYSPSDIYNSMLKELGKTKKDIPKTLAMLIWERGNRFMMEKLFEGQKLQMLHKRGYIVIKEKKRNFARKVINWPKSNQNKKEIIEKGGVPYKALERNNKGEVVKDNGGEKWVELFKDDSYLMIVWEKRPCTIPNSSVYAFLPAFGFYKELHKRNNEDPFFNVNFKNN